MQLNTRTFITLLIAGVGTIYLYYGLSGDEIRPKTDTHKQIVSYEIVETDTGKRLETYANSGTDWGMTPFGSGKPLEEMEEEKLVFQKPNTEWKTRTISGVTYVFGEGNPKEVALTAEQVEDTGKLCESHENAKVLYDTEFCNPETERLKYLTAEAEKHVLAALSDPNWEKLATECENNFRAMETADTFQNAERNPNFPYFDRVFTPGFLDIENFVSVEPTTGWKKLNTGRTIGLTEFMMIAMEDGYKNASGVKNPYGNCVDKYGKDIIQHLVNATSSYMWPVD
ncbi:MAG: hypothetical protein WAW59_03080 [Patescibacteria group bacterium]